MADPSLESPNAASTSIPNATHTVALILRINAAIEKTFVLTFMAPAERPLSGSLAVSLVVVLVMTSDGRNRPSRDAIEQGKLPHRASGPPSPADIHKRIRYGG